MAVRPCFCDRCDLTKPYAVSMCRFCYLYYTYRDVDGCEWNQKAGLGDWLWAAVDRLTAGRLRGRKCGCDGRRQWVNRLTRGLWRRIEAEVLPRCTGRRRMSSSCGTRS